ncbi:MAG TPA: class I SAM-dependent methyltransferase [Thermoplasmata archaeon]|nr:class I SAM-dependent methyltransferase [Thermoplasmata archaeon]
MSFYDLLADGYWVYKRTRVPAFVEALTGAKPGSVRPFVPELVKEGIHERKEVLLYLLVRSLRPERVVETGVWYGWSSRAILTALHANARGQLTSIDLPTTGTGRTYSDGTFDPIHVGAAADTGRAVPEYLRDRWNLRVVGTAAESTAALETASAEGTDMFLHDSEHSYENMSREFRIAWDGLRPRGVLYADDVDWNRAFPEFARSVARPPRFFRLYPLKTPTVGALVK